MAIVARRRRQVVGALWTLPLVTYRLHRTGYEATRAWLDARSPSPANPTPTGPSDREPATDRLPVALDLAFVVRLVARLVPDATCLRKALVLRHILAGEGIDSTIRLGVRSQDDDQRYGFHAWVEVDGVVVSEPAETIEPYSVLIESPQ